MSRLLKNKHILYYNIKRYYSVEYAQVSAKFSNGRSITLESGKYARLASGSVLATMGRTSVMVAAVSSETRTNGPMQSFLPLVVDYRQKFAAAGRIPSNYLRREMGVSEQEILTSRIIDRSLRPMFPEGFTDDVQLTCTLTAVDGAYSPDVVSINAASAALAVSNIPFSKPVGAVRLGMLDEEIIISPTIKELEESSLDLVVTAAGNNALVMLEGGCTDILLPKLQKAIKVGVKECQHIIKAIEQLSSKVGKPKKSFKKYVVPEDIKESVDTMSRARLTAVFSDITHHKQSRDDAVSAIRNDVINILSTDHPGQENHVRAAFDKLCKSIFRQLILDTRLRCDGRSPTQLRHIKCETDLFPGLHGSSLFQRGQTQVQCTVAYDSNHASSPINPLIKATGGAKDRNFLLHYTFPQFATNDLKKAGGLVSRREIGHGALAERALRPLMPSNSPFTILLEATVLESNGSSSMATVCGGSMALYDAGVKLTAPAAGVAIGLVTDTDEQGNITRYQVLTDILGIEDYMGDMDFKIAGTKHGITAVQADIKLPGVPQAIIQEALMSATEPRCQILELMDERIPAPVEDKDCWPLTSTIEVPPHKRSSLIGPGGVNMKRITTKTGVELWWDDNDRLSIFAANSQSYDEAKQMIDALIKDDEPELEFMAIYNAKVEEVRRAGVMVTLYDGMKPALIHKSVLSDRMVEHAEALGINVGDVIKVKYFGRDPVSGQMRLSRRALQPNSGRTKSLLKPATEA